MNAPFRAVLSPCIGICSLGDDGYCLGCHRTSAEISRWSQMSDDERLRLMEMCCRSGSRASDRAADCPMLPRFRHCAAPRRVASAGRRAGRRRLESRASCWIWSPSCGSVAAAVLVGLVPRAEGLQVLLTRRNDGMRHHPGQVSFPGGRIETDDADAAAAAIREAGEEIGMPADQITPLGYLDPLATITGFRVLPLAAVITPDYRRAPRSSRG